MYTPEQVYQEIGTAVPFSKWCKSHCIKADESLSETDRVMLIFSSRNTKAKEELAAEIAREKERLALIKTPPELIEGNIFAEGFKTVGNEVVISSRAVAEILGSRHTEVLRSIDREWRALKVILEEEKHKDCPGRQVPPGVRLEHLYLVWESMITTNAAEIEAAIHKHFEDKHVHGEWFAVSPEEAFDYINTLDFGRVLIS